MKIELLENLIPTATDNSHARFVELLKAKGFILSVAESFTGGNIASEITSVSGASSVFYEGIVAYNEKAKISRLGVQATSIERFKPVSFEVAKEMVQGLLKQGNCNFAISTTGIAGPNSDDSGFPVGLCFIGIGYGDKILVYKFNLQGTRSEIINQGTDLAIRLAIDFIKNI
ncbi:MAG: CinA family protein [Clostridia bacterium]|nr:CinA family protein [Clostridia bacterium]